MDKVTQDARALSSGTIAGLIDDTSYVVIDKVQAEFVAFCIDHEGGFENWIQAWNKFHEQKCKNIIQDYNLVPTPDGPQYTFLTPPDQQLALL